MRRYVITAEQLQTIANALGKVKVEIYSDLLLAEKAKATIEHVIREQPIVSAADSEAPDPFEANAKAG